MDVATTTNKPVTFKVSKLIAVARDAGVTLSVTAVTSPTTHGGTVVLNSGATPTITYTPATDYSGPDSISYTLSDTAGGSSAGTVAVTITEGNFGPVLTGVKDGNNHFQITTSGMTNQTYIVQISTNGTTPYLWHDYATTNSAPNGVLIWTDPKLMTEHPSPVFYRLAQP
jgi:hypothetical protein